MSQTNNLDITKKVPGIELVSWKEKYDPRTQMDFCETKWNFRGHKIDVNIDEHGYHPRIDEGGCPGVKDEGGLINWLLDCLGVER